MTNVSIYTYENLQEYIKLYPKGQDKLTENHLSALWINKKTIVLVSDNRDKASTYRPDFSKSIVYFDGGEDAFEKYEPDFEPVVEVIRKGNVIKFIGQEVEHELAIARSFGEPINGHVRGYILYDDSRPRLNLIMKSLT